MSVQAITGALAMTGIGASEKFLLVVLANYADADFSCWPSVKRLCADTGMGERTVQRSLKALEAAGLVRRDERRRPDGSRTSDRLTLVFEGGANLTPPPANLAPAPRKFDTTPPQICHPPPANLAPLTTFEPSVEPSVEPSGKNARAFERFWRAYPSKVGKRAAEVAFAKASQRAPPDQIIAGVQTALAECDQWRRGFIPNPTTWLNQDRWNDEHAPPPVSDQLVRRHENYRRAFAGASAAFDAPDFDR
jgi:DNA-binding transcriptional ArsR family regulator